MKYTVIEAQEVTRVRLWTWTVEAADAEEARRKAMNGEGEMCEDGGRNIGEEEYGASGWAVDTGDNDPDEEAIDDIAQGMGFPPDVEEEN